MKKQKHLISISEEEPFFTSDYELKNQWIIKASLKDMVQSEPSIPQFAIVSEGNKVKHFGSIVAVLGVGKAMKHVVLSNSRFVDPTLDVYDIFNEEKVEAPGEPIEYESKMELVEFAKTGVAANTIHRLADILKIPIKDIVEFFNLSGRTLRKYVKENIVLDPDSSEKILKIFSLYLYGCDVLGGSENFVKWIQRPSFGLRNKIPAELLYSSDGIDLVRDELSRIEFGDIA